MNKLLIVIPAFNEGKNIEKVVDNLIENYAQYDYLIINDGSIDDTAKICTLRKYQFLDLPINLGLSGAFQAGVRYAYEMGYEMVLQLDGDGQHNPKYIESMIQCMEQEKVDVVIGSRFIDNPKKKNNMRVIGSSIIGKCIWFTTKTSLTDPTSGMRLYNKSIMKEFAYIMNYTPEPDTISLLIRNGINVKEIQVEIEERTEGKSYLNVKNSIKYMLHMCISILFVQRFRMRRS